MNRSDVTETTYTFTDAELADIIEEKVIKETGGVPGGTFATWERDSDGCLAVTFRRYS